MLCCSENCDRKNQCALFYRNPQPEYRKYDNVESLATHGWGSINFNGCKSYSDCGPLGDYKMFINSGNNGQIIGMLIMKNNNGTQA